MTDTNKSASVAEKTLDGPISCLSLYPQNEKIVVVGTYELQDIDREQQDLGSSQIRRGKIYVLEITEQFKIYDVEETAYGILDLRFSPFDPDLLAVATSIGRVDLFKLCPESFEVERVKSFSVEVDSILILHLDWFPHPPSLDETRIAVSLSDGRIAVLLAQPQHYRVDFVQAHSLEAWFVAWDPLNASSIYSGGDDSWFCVSSDPDGEQDQSEGNRREGELEKEKSRPFYCNRKIHQAGVTSILPLPYVINGYNIVLTGSYDEHLRVLSQKHGSSRWEVNLEFPLGGGVWRLKTLKSDGVQLSRQPDRSLTVLASCMHAGPKIVQIDIVDSISMSAKVLAGFNEHASMNYASDARFSNSLGWTIVSSSFYDKKVCLWHFAQPANVT